ncbi:MAG TPA: aminotransferase class IV [Thermoleophilaceae bacterium]|nr:aminotransferase class IV [Thermoleophilaceae bacterium]
MPDELASLDGLIEPALETTIPITDEGFLRGDGVFEVLRVYDGVPFALDDHLIRLERSTTNLRLGWSAPRADLEKDVERLLEARGAGFSGCVRIVLTRGGRRLVITEQLPAAPAEARLTYVEYCPSRLLDGVKSLSYAANMLANRIARERGFDEALLVTPHGRVLEAPTSTLFWCTPDGTLATPPLDDHILASITRAHVIEGTGAEERVCTKDDLAQATEAFLASTTREVQPVAAIDELELSAPGELTQKAASTLRVRIQEALGADG